MKHNLFSLALIRGAFANNFELQNYEPLIRKNVSVTAFTSFLPLEKNICIPTRHLPSLYDVSRYYSSSLFTEKMVRFISNRIQGDAHILYGLENTLLDYDILHTADSHYYFSYQAARVKKNHPNKLFVSTSWETKAFNNESVPLKKKLKDFVKNQIDLFLCYSRKAAAALTEEHVPPEKILHLPLGVDTEVFSPSTKRQKLILFAGRFEKEKDPITVLKAFRIIAREHKDYKLLMVGGGSLEKTLKDMVEDFGLSSKVEITHQDYSQMPSVYKKAQYLVVPSIITPTWEEQYGMVFVEALSSGIPIITTKSGAIEEVVGEAGVYCRERDFVAIATELKKLITSSDHTRALASYARKRALVYFDRMKFANKIQYIYEKHLSNYHR